MKASGVKSGFMDLTGGTPLVRLNRMSEETGCEILAKVELMNGGGSVKDRPALYLIREAVNSEKLRPGGTIIEGTAGNTGIGLAHMCNSMGFKCIFFMPDIMSQEKIDLLRTLGAEVRPVPVAPWSDPANYCNQAEALAKSMDNAYWTHQFDNLANKRSHYETTGPEIWKDTNGTVDAVVLGTGTGGTLAGVSTYLKEQNQDIKAFLVDPPGSMLYNYFKHGKLEASEGRGIAEGVGQTRITKNLEGAPIDDALYVADQDIVNTVLQLLNEEGLFVGGSSGMNVFAAYTVAQMMGPGHTIVTALCDGGQRYFNKIFSKAVLEERGLYDGVPDKYKKCLH